MKNNSKYMVGVLLLCLVLITGCRAKEKIEDPEGSPTTEISQTPEISSIPEVGDLEKDENEVKDDQENKEQNDNKEATQKPSETEIPSKKPEKKETKELPIYSINDDTLEIEATVALISKDMELNAEVVVNAVVDNFSEHELNIGIDIVTQEDDAVIVSFLADKIPLIGVGSGVEATILDCISQSLLDNLNSCKKVIFQVEGKAYESGHMLFDIDEPYSWK